MSVTRGHNPGTLPKRFLVTRREIDPPEGWERLEFAATPRSLELAAPVSLDD